MAHASVILDTFPYGGCLTAQEAMSNGKVVVTLPSDYVRGRFTMNLYEQMGGDVAWPIAADERDFVRVAVRVATDEGYRKYVRGMLRERWPKVHKEELGVEWARFIESA
jgi:predicted O-linked N-acetylglucosamine transferase (SPINDLY family)